MSVLAAAQVVEEALGLTPYIRYCQHCRECPTCVQWRKTNPDQLASLSSKSGCSEVSALWAAAVTQIAGTAFLRRK